MKNKKLYIVALSFVLAFVLFIWGFNFLKGKDVFKNERHFYVEYNQVSGLIRANPVDVNGFRVGQIRDIYFHPKMNGRLIVKISLTTDIPIPSNTIARIYSSDLMGSKAIELQLGNSKVYLKENDTLKSSVETSLMDEVNAQVLPLKNKAESLISSVDSLVTIMQTLLSKSAQENIFLSLQSISVTIKNLERTTAAIDSFVSTEQSRLASIFYNVELITRNLEQSNKEISRIIGNTAAISDSIAKADVAATIRNANASLADLNKILSAINQGQGTIGQLIKNDTLYYNLQNSANELNKLIEDVRLNPKRYVKISVF